MALPISIADDLLLVDTNVLIDFSLGIDSGYVDCFNCFNVGNTT
jgi:hypothetical protein